MRGAADNLFTWQQALERIVLGWMLPDDGSPLWQNVSAWHGDVNRLDVFGRFAAFIRTLSRLAAEWRKPAAAEEWTERCRDLVQSLFLPDADDQYALQQFEQALAKWQEETALAGFRGTLPQHTVIRHLRRFLGSESQAGFLRGGITFCSMVPMRSLPFKVICLLGLNDGDFPRNTKAAVFDLIAKHPQKGDRARRDDDRYLFLEAIISARDILYLSYVGRSIRNDDELAPSALVSELIDTIAAMTGRRSKELAEHWVEQHPLQPFSHRYFIADNISDDLFSTRQDYAEALNRPREQARPFFSEALEENSPAPTVWQDDFIRFWKNPVKAWLQQTLGWREPYRDEAWESAEPFEPQRADKIAAAYLDARRHNQDFQETAVRLDAESLLPAGELGKLWQQNFQAAAKRIDGALLQSPKLPPFAYEIPFDGQTLQGSLGNLYQCGQVFYLDRKPNAPQRIAILLEHLIFCAVGSSETETRQTHIVQPEETTLYPAISSSHAQEMLQKWLTFFNLGQTRPLPFFAKTSLAAAEAYGKKQSWEDALNKAKESYHGNKVSKGQKDYTEVALVFDNEDTEPVEGALFQRLVEELLIPLLDAVKEESSDAA